MGSAGSGTGMAHSGRASGFEKMERGALKAKWTDRENPLSPHISIMNAHHIFDPKAPFACVKSIGVFTKAPANKTKCEFTPILKMAPTTISI